MFKFVCLFALASCACAASIADVDNKSTTKPPVHLLSYEAEKNPDGSFHFSYEGSDKSHREEKGTVVDAGTEDEALEVTGSYRYIDADGQEIEVRYTAGKNGFVPIGTNIPSEISNLAKAAADLPNETEVEEQVKRRARSKTVEPENIPVKVVVSQNDAKDDKVVKPVEVVKTEKA